MEYEDIWQKIKKMSQRNRIILAYEMTLKGYNVGYIHPHYYFDAKVVHDILFYPPKGQREIEDKDGKYYNALKEIIENDGLTPSPSPKGEGNIHIILKRCTWLPRFINDWREGKVVKSYICSRINEEYVNAYYRILPGDSLAGERPRSLFITLKDGSEVVYKMTTCNYINGYEEMTFHRMDNTYNEEH